MILGKRRHEEITDRCLRFPNNFDSETIEMSTTQWRYCIMDLESIDTKNLNGTRQSQLSKCCGCGGVLHSECGVKNCTCFSLTERNVTESKRRNHEALVGAVALEYFSQNQFLDGLNDVRPLLERRAKPGDLPFVIFSRDF